MELKTVRGLKAHVPNFHFILNVTTSVKNESKYTLEKKKKNVTSCFAIISSNYCLMINCFVINKSNNLMGIFLPPYSLIRKSAFYSSMKIADVKQF